MALTQITAVSQTIIRALPPGISAAAHHHLLGLGRAHSAARHEGPGAFRTGAVRLRVESRSQPDGHRAGRRDSLALWREAAPGVGECGYPGAASQGALAGGRDQRHQLAEPGAALRHGQAGSHRIQRRDERFDRHDRRAERPADQDQQRRDHLCARRRLRQRRLLAADQHRAHGRPARRAGDDLQNRRRLDARRRLAGLCQAAADRIAPAAAAGDDASIRPVDFRARRRAGSDPRRTDRRLLDGADDPAVPGKLAQHADHRHLHSAFDSGLHLRA